MVLEAELELWLRRIIVEMSDGIFDVMPVMHDVLTCGDDDGGIGWTHCIYIFVRVQLRVYEMLYNFLLQLHLSLF